MITTANNILNTVWENRYFPVDPIWIAKKMGLSVYSLETPPDVSGALVKRADRDPVILLNQNDSEQRMRFTCAHELGHYIQRLESNIENSKEYEYVDLFSKLSQENQNEEEKLANKFALALLIPKEALLHDVKENCSPAMMAYRFGVPDDVIRVALEEYGIHGYGR
ncbi:ImmA/IrrE family metallo-endopeptidase [Thorsellia kenyensis]|uniref:ImmA/IrrE family metallo-endopeptidase n=1 Tax=Thorsellia kenyensis TaxID=1549888 RepID=A0ABV6CCQ0_9GAMM